jgi:hypothetical protein
MRIRKILPLVLLAVGSVFLLTSCDALLDGIFGQNTVTVYASARILTYGYFPSTDYVTVSVAGKNATANYDGYDGVYMYWSIQIPGISDGTYTVTTTYNHPVGPNGPSVSAPYPVSFPASSGSAHSVNLNVNF